MTWFPGWQENKSLTKEIVLFRNHYFPLFAFTIYPSGFLLLFVENNVAKIVFNNALRVEIIDRNCHSLCCFLSTSKLVKRRFC